MLIDGERVRLASWAERHRPGLHAMQADPQVMADQGGQVDADASDAKLARYAAAEARYGFCRWAVEDREGLFLGYTGVMPIVAANNPLDGQLEIGWRLAHHAWGHGFATEAARLALADGWGRCGLGEVLAYTAADNLRSQAVMARLGLTREPERDFVNSSGWRGLVWSASPPSP